MSQSKNARGHELERALARVGEVRAALATARRLALSVRDHELRRFVLQAADRLDAGVSFGAFLASDEETVRSLIRAAEELRDRARIAFAAEDARRSGG